MKYLIAFLAVISLLVPFTTHADILPEGNHVVNNQFIVDNISSYSGYNFYLTFSRSKYPGAQQITQVASQITFSGPAQFIAVKKENQSRIKSGTQANCPECGDTWFDLGANKSLIIPASLNLHFDAYLPDTNPTTKETQTIHIDSLTSDTITAHLITSNTENKQVTPVAIPSQSSTTMLLVVSLIVCLGVIGVLVAKLTWKK